ncbi:MAG: DUF885 domain-containing protein [Bacilli bacterium]|nr:DUF885 domain-containing protein [Bacilli bacterium]
MKNLWYKVKYAFLTTLALVLVFVVAGCNIKIPKENFDNFTNNIFKTIIGNDEFTSNFLFNDPTAFGLERYEPSLPTPGKTQALGVLIINLYFGQVKNFDYDELNEDQQMTYDVIVDLLDNINAKTSEMSYLSNNYLGSYLGYQAQLPLLLVEYHFKDKLDVDNYFKYLDLVPETFKKYVDFEIEKADNGYGMPDFVIDKVVEQCVNFIGKASEEDHFMIKVVNDKIDKLEFLSDEEKETYKELNKEKVKGPLIEGYAYVRDHLPLLKGKATNNMGLAHYYTTNEDTNEKINIGQKYYELSFQKAVGYNISVEEAIAYVESKLNTYTKELETFRKLAKDDSTFLTRVSETKFMSQTPEEQLALYQRIIYSDFPTLNLENDLNVEIKYIDKAMEENFSPAAYMTSPIDEFKNEYIYLNNKSILIDQEDSEGNVTKVYDYNYLFTTLAHEGYPGHLYQNVYFKNKQTNVLRKVLKSSGYMEGWATYVENYMYNFLEGFDQDIIDYYLFQENYQAAIYSRLDMGIHYNGWTLEETYDYLSKYYNVTLESTKSIYERLIEVPNNCQYYYFTYFKLCDMYDKVKTALGNKFDPVEYHKRILDCGPLPLRFVEKRVLASYGL